MYVKPAPEKVVRLPDGRLVPERGLRIGDDRPDLQNYCRRRTAEGGLVECDPPKAAKAPPAKAADQPAD